MKDNKINEETKDTEIVDKKDEKEKVENTTEDNNSENEKNTTEEYDIPFIDPTVYSYKKKRHIKRYVTAGLLGLVLIAYFSGVL